MIGHHGVAVQLKVPHRSCAKVDGFDNQIRDLRPAEITRASLRPIQQAVHGGEGFSRLEIGGEMAVFGEAAGQAPRQEDRMSNQMEMGQSANVESGHTKESGFGADCLKPTWPIGNRPQVSNLPHKTERRIT
jgi:hypothetical protein